MSMFQSASTAFIWYLFISDAQSGRDNSAKDLLSLVIGNNLELLRLISRNVATAGQFVEGDKNGPILPIHLISFLCNPKRSQNYELPYTRIVNSDWLDGIIIRFLDLLPYSLVSVNQCLTVVINSLSSTKRLIWKLATSNTILRNFWSFCHHNKRSITYC